MGCNFCDDCSDCTVGEALDCGEWDPDEHRESRDDYYDDCYDYNDDEYNEDNCDEVNNMSEGAGRHCVNCGASASMDWNFCLACGAELPEKHCVRCGRIVADDWEYCPYCGSSIPIKTSIFMQTPQESVSGSMPSIDDVPVAYDDSDMPF